MQTMRIHTATRKLRPWRHPMLMMFFLLLLALNTNTAWGQTTVSYDFSAGGAVTGLNQAAPGIALDANIGFGSFQNSGTVAPALNGGQLRLYQNSTKGGSIKIYANNGVTITKVVVYAASSGDGDGPAGYCVDNPTEVGTFSGGGTMTMNVTATDYVEFYNKGNSTSTRTYVNSFEVTYTSGGTPSITLADNGTQVVAANVAQGTTAHILHKSQLSVTTANATLTGMSCTTVGTIDADDISNLKVRYSTDATLDAGDATLSTITSPGIAGAESFGAFTSQVINSGATGYIFITADIASGANAGNTISVDALAPSNFTFSSGSPTGSTNAGGAQTIIVATPSITLADNGTQVAAANVAQGTTAHVLHKFLLAVTTANATLTGVQATTAGTYASADLTNLKVRYSTDATLDAGDATLSTYTSVPTAGTLTFPTFTSQTINSGNTGYIFITADIASGATVGNTISVNAVTTGQLTFSSGNKSGSTTAGGAQTITAAPSGCTSDLIISEYVEGSSNNKFIELYNGTGAAVNLGNYSLRQYNNGDINPTYTLVLSGTLNDGDTYVIENSSESIGVAADLSTTSNVMAFNGDDAIELYKTSTSTSIDIIGRIGQDPGTEWGSGVTSTADNTLVRKATITAGDNNGSDAFDPSIEWDGYAQDNTTNLGSHTINCSPSITINGDDPSSADFYQGSNNNILYRIAFSSAGGQDQDVTAIQIRIDALATNLNILVSNFKLYVSNDATWDAGDTQLDDETTIATANNQTITFNGFTQTVNDGTTRYFFITTDVLSNANISEQLQASNAAVTHTNNGTPVVTSNYVAANIHNINSGISVSGSDPSTTDFSKGSTGNVLYRIALTINGQARTLTDIAVTIEGTVNLNNLLTKYEAYYSTDDTYDGADVLLDDETTINAATSQAVFFTCSQALAAGSTYYIFITCDIPTSATGGEFLSALNTAMNVDFTGSPTPDSESYTAANLHEILDTPSDVVAVSGSESDYVSSIVNTVGPLNSTDGVRVWQFTVRDGGEYGDGDALATIVTALTLTQNTGNAMNNWSDAIESCALFNESGTRLATATVTTNQIQFTGFSQSVSDNSQHTFTVRLSIQTSPNNSGTNNDGDDFVFNLSNANITADPAGSQFGSFPVASSVNGKNVFQVVATTLTFIQQPTDVGIDAIMVPYVKVQGTDANGNIDNGPLTISVTSTGTMDVATKYASIVNGVATFGDIIHIVLGTNLILTASATGATNATSDPFDVLDVTTFKPGELLVIGFDSRVDGGSSDAIYIATLVDIKPGTKFKWVNSRFEAGAVANERTLHWGGSGDEPYEDPSYIELEWNGAASITAGSIISFTTSGQTVDNPRVNGVAETDLIRSSYQDFANVSATDGDQMWLVQGEFVPYGTVNVDRYSLLNGTVLFGLTSIEPWVPITDAVSDADNGAGRESRKHPDIECFSIDLSLTTSSYIYYENGTGTAPGSPVHTGTKRAILMDLQTSANWTSGTGTLNLDIDEEFIAANVAPSVATSIGKQFSVTASGVADGTWLGGATGQTTDWFYCGNWQGLTVPDKETDVVIPNVANSPDIDCNTTNTDAKKFAYVAECNNLTIDASATLTVDDNIDTLKIYGNLLNSGTIDADGATNDGQIWIDGNWTNNGTFTYGTSNVVFHGTAQTIATNAANETFYNVFFLNGTKTLDDPIVANDITIADVALLDANDNDISLTGNWTNYNNSAFDESNTLVTFNGTNQSITCPGGEIFNDITFANSGTKTLINDINAAELTISGTAALTPGTNSITVSENWNQAAVSSFVPGNSLVTFNGALAQVIDNLDDMAINFNNITISGANSKTFSDNINIGGNLIINSATLSAPASIDIDGNWTNNGGTYSHNNGSVIFSGSTQQSITGSETFYNLTMDNTGNTLSLNNNITVNNTLTLTNGVINTGSNRVDLGNAATISETDASFVTGNVRTTRNIGSTSGNQTFGGLGLELTESATTDNSTQVTRVTGTALAGNASCCGSNWSIQRYFDIVPADNTDLNASMVYHYFDHELNGVTETDLVMFRADLPFAGADPWTAMKGTVNTTANTVSLSGLTQFSRWAAASEASPLPVDLLYFNAQLSDGKVKLNWATASETNNAYFTIERSSDLKNILTIATISGAGNSNTMLQYQNIDAQPLPGVSYYRLRQTDFDGTTTFGKWAKVINAAADKELQIIKAVAKSNELSVTISCPGKTAYVLEVYDITGNRLYSGMVQPDNEWMQHDLPLLQPQNMYIIKASDAQTVKTLKVVK